MESALNFAWMVLAALMLWLWLRYAPSEGASQRTQIVALVVIILILFPAISVTDDLVAAQNTTEVEACQRKDHACSNAHFTLHPVAMMSFSTSAELLYRSLGVAAVNRKLVPLLKNPAMASIQNRPPPTAHESSFASGIVVLNYFA